MGLLASRGIDHSRLVVVNVVTIEQFREDGKLMRFSRTLKVTESDYMNHIVSHLARGKTISQVLQ